MPCGQVILVSPLVVVANHRSLRVQVVNALLTQLDKLKHRKNVLVMTTSNLSAAIGALACLGTWLHGTDERLSRWSVH